MASYWRDPEFQQQIVAALCRDRNFLKRVSGLLSASDFKPRRNSGEGPEVGIIAEKALDWWQKYREPIGGMLKSEIQEHIYQNKDKIGRKTKDKLLGMLEEIRSNHSLVAVEALEHKVRVYKNRRAKQHAIMKLIEMQEKGELEGEQGDARFQRVIQETLENFKSDYKVTSFFSAKELGHRILRRQQELGKRWPTLLIPEIDNHVRAITRKGLGLVLALYKVGKSICLIWIAHAMAWQGYNTLFFTLEDPKELVEDRLDALFTGMSMSELSERPHKLKRRLKKARERILGRIKIIDATDGGWTVARIEEAWEAERNRGFTADCVIIDYDDEIQAVGKYPGESARRMQFAEIYRDLRGFAARNELFVWTAAQTKRGSENRMIVRGGDVAEDISKIRKVSFCLGVGAGPSEWKSDDARHLFIAAHKFDKQHMGWNIMGSFAHAMFYDREATQKKLKEMEKIEE